MSYELFDKARRVDLSGIQAEKVSKSSLKLVLLVMAGTAKPHYFASVAQLAKDTHLDRKAIYRALHALEAGGVIRDTKERLGQTRQVVVWELFPELSTKSTQRGTVPKEEQYPITDRSVPNYRPNSTQLGICNSSINLKNESLRAPAPVDTMRAAITGASK